MVDLSQQFYWCKEQAVFTSLFRLTAPYHLPLPKLRLGVLRQRCENLLKMAVWRRGSVVSQVYQGRYTDLLEALIAMIHETLNLIYLTGRPMF